MTSRWLAAPTGAAVASIVESRRQFRARFRDRSRVHVLAKSEGLTTRSMTAPHSAYDEFEFASCRSRYLTAKSTITSAAFVIEGDRNRALFQVREGITR